MAKALKKAAAAPAPRKAVEKAMQREMKAMKRVEFRYEELEPTCIGVKLPAGWKWGIGKDCLWSFIELVPGGSRRNFRIHRIMHRLI